MVEGAQGVTIKIISLRVLWGDAAPVGATLHLDTGKRYQVIRARGAVMRCRLMAPGEPDVEPVLRWTMEPHDAGASSRGFKAWLREEERKYRELCARFAHLC